MNQSPFRTISQANTRETIYTQVLSALWFFFISLVSSFLSQYKTCLQGREENICLDVSPYYSSCNFPVNKKIINHSYQILCAFHHKIMLWRISFALSSRWISSICSKKKKTIIHVFCVEVLRPSQPNGVMSSAVSLPNHTFTGQALSSKRLTSIVHILSPETDNCPSWISGRERMTNYPSSLMTTWWAKIAIQNII